MDFIAAYWWLWLAGLLATLAVVTWRVIANGIGMVRDTVEITGKVRDAVNAPEGQRRRELARVGIEVAADKVRDRVVNQAVTAVIVAFAAIFGLLLILAIVRHLSE